MKKILLILFLFPLITSCFFGPYNNSNILSTNSPAKSSINSSTISLGREVNGIYNDMFSSKSILIDKKISNNNSRRAQRENQVQFWDSEGEIFEQKPHLIDYSVYQNLSYYVFSSLPLENTRFLNSLNYNNGESKNKLIRDLAFDYKEDKNDVFSYYLINHLDGSVIDLKKSVYNFNNYFRGLKNFIEGEYIPTNSGGSTENAFVFQKYCGLEDVTHLFSFGFLGTTLCYNEVYNSNEWTELVLFTFNSDINDFIHTLYPFQNISWTFISPTGIGLGIDSGNNQVKYDFLKQVFLPVDDLINYFNPNIYSWNGELQPKWFEQIFIKKPLYYNENFIYYSDYDRIIQFDSQFNFVSYLINNSPHNHAYSTLQHQMDGYSTFNLGTMDKYEVILVYQFDWQSDINQSFMLLIDRVNLSITISNTIPVTINHFILLGNTFVGYSSISKVVDIELFQWTFSNNNFKSLYDFDLSYEEQLQGSYDTLIPTQSVEIASTGYAKVLMSNSTNSIANYKIISLLDGKLYDLNEVKPVQIFSNQISIIK
jgi:hypothetical protein